MKDHFEELVRHESFCYFPSYDQFPEVREWVITIQSSKPATYVLGYIDKKELSAFLHCIFKKV